MLLCRYFFLVVLGLISTNFAECAEFVPVYMWGTNKVSEHVPALHKISEDSFKDTLLEYLRNDPYIIVFAERTLSPEDFAQRDVTGKIAYPHLYELKEKASVAYKPYVQNPIGAIKHLEKEITEVSIGSFLNNPNVPKDNILIIDLNDAKDDEQRFHMLKRHDSAILSIYKNIVEKHDNVLAFYTAHHTSWVAPVELTRAKSRSLLQSEDPSSKPLIDPLGMVYFSKDPYVITNDQKQETITVNGITVSGNDTYRVIELTATGAATKFTFPFDLSSQQYWILEDATATINSSNVALPLKTSFPNKFSYHCASTAFKLGEAKDSPQLVLPGFQIQPFSVPLNDTSKGAFGDPYSCVGFTTIPIWSGLFITALFLIILTFGITMMLDIRTMDRFDDAKGKTITINAGE